MQWQARLGQFLKIGELNEFDAAMLRDRVVAHEGSAPDLKAIVEIHARAFLKIPEPKVLTLSRKWIFALDSYLDLALPENENALRRHIRRKNQLPVVKDVLFHQVGHPAQNILIEASEQRHITDKEEGLGQVLILILVHSIINRAKNGWMLILDLLNGIFGQDLRDCRLLSDNCGRPFQIRQQAHFTEQVTWSESPDKHLNIVMVLVMMVAILDHVLPLRPLSPQYPVVVLEELLILVKFHLMNVFILPDLEHVGTL